LGGLAPDNDQPMPLDTQQYIQQNWQRIEQTITGIQFNYQFWQQCKLKRSTYAACRAIIAARNQGKDYADLMNTAIQRAYYQQARNPSERETLIELGVEIGLSKAEFVEDLTSQATDKVLQQEIAYAQAMNANTYPSVVLEVDQQFAHLPVDYNDPRQILAIISSVRNT
ncbi:MAG: DsbA family protein, partial [Alteromonas sp.]